MKSSASKNPIVRAASKAHTMLKMPPKSHANQHENARQTKPENKAKTKNKTQKTNSQAHLKHKKLL